jgi:hypothetical protein
MSNKAQMDPAVTAYDTLSREVYLPAFVEKCAAEGLQFPDEESIQAALESVAMLKAAEAAESTDLTKSARADLGRLLGEPAPEQAAATEEDLKKAAELVKLASVKQALGALRARQSA